MHERKVTSGSKDPASAVYVELANAIALQAAAIAQGRVCGPL